MSAGGAAEKMASNTTRRQLTRNIGTGMGSAGRFAAGPWVALAGQVVEALAPLLKSQQMSSRRLAARVKRLEARVEALEARLRSAELPPTLPPTIGERHPSG